MQEQQRGNKWSLLELHWHGLLDLLLFLRGAGFPFAILCCSDCTGSRIEWSPQVREPGVQAAGEQVWTGRIHGLYAIASLARMIWPTSF